MGSGRRKCGLGACRLGWAERAGRHVFPSSGSCGTARGTVFSDAPVPLCSIPQTVVLTNPNLSSSVVLHYIVLSYKLWNFLNNANTPSPRLIPVPLPLHRILQQALRGNESSMEAEAKRCLEPQPPRQQHHKRPPCIQMAEPWVTRG